MGTGQHSNAVELLAAVPADAWPPGLGLMRSRMEMQEGEVAAAIASSEAVLNAVVPGTPESDHALLNLATMHILAGGVDASRHMAERLRTTTASEDLRLIADATSVLIDSASDGDVRRLARILTNLAARQRGLQPHYFGVTQLNLATLVIVMDDPILAVEHADEAIEALRETSSRIELSTALMTKAVAMTHLGKVAQARRIIDEARSLGQAEALLEDADLADSFLDPDAAWYLLESADARAGLSKVDRSFLAIQTSRFMARRGDFVAARASFDQDDESDLMGYIGRRTVRLATEAYIAAAGNAENKAALIDRAYAAAQRQGATRYKRLVEVIRGWTLGDREYNDAIRAVGVVSPWNITFVADLIVRDLERLDEDALKLVRDASQLHPGRWRFALRAQLIESHNLGPRAAFLLEDIGEKRDVQLLRDFARKHRKMVGASSVGRRLARRIAERVFVEDEGRVSIRVGDRVVPGSVVRRKVLGLLCFLLTRPQLSSTRDQVLDALWPDLDPLDAVNSLNQTVYFLRRVLEENYVEDLSPGYLHHDSDLIWLDPELVGSRSNECRRLIKAMPPTPTSEQVSSLAELYRGRFALDFEYEEWTSSYRDWLHASFLEIVERAVTSDLETGHYQRGIHLARRVLDIDNGADRVEMTLLRLYRASGAYSAAAEQYGHYASAMRDQLGIEPPPLESL
jgi:DNA-binding SARP family transcriptional activator